MIYANEQLNSSEHSHKQNPNLNVDLLKIEQVVIFLRIKGRPCDKNLSKTPKDDSTFCNMKSDVTDYYFYHDDTFNLLVKWQES